MLFTYTLIPYHPHPSFDCGDDGFFFGGMLHDFQSIFIHCDWKKVYPIPHTIYIVHSMHSQEGLILIKEVPLVLLFPHLPFGVLLCIVSVYYTHKMTIHVCVKWWANPIGVT